MEHLCKLTEKSFKVAFHSSSVLSKLSHPFQESRWILPVLFLWLYNTRAQTLSHVQLFATPRTISYEAPLSMGFSRQEYCSGLPFPSPNIHVHAYISFKKINWITPYILFCNLIDHWIWFEDFFLYQYIWHYPIPFNKCLMFHRISEDIYILFY